MVSEARVDRAMGCRSLALLTVVIGVAVAAIEGTAFAAAWSDSRFGAVTLVSGLRAPTAVTVGPQGRLFVAEQGGRVLTALPGRPPRTLLDISAHVNSYFERGLLGIALDRKFARNGVLYLLYTFENDPAHPDGPGRMTARLVRVVVRHPADPRPMGKRPAERVLLGAAGGSGPCRAPSNGVDCVPSDGTSHTIGTVRVDRRDGTLWVSDGDGYDGPVANEVPLRAYDETSYAGKILHVDGSGRGLARHPFCPQDHDRTHVCTKVYATGFRNPFRFTVDPSDGMLYVGDVGWFQHEEVDGVTAGGDYGWPCYEGARQDGSVQHTFGYRDLAPCQALYRKETDVFHPPARQPLLSYSRGGTSAVVGGPRFHGGAFPRPYRDALFYGDFEQRSVRLVALDRTRRPVGRPRSFAKEWDGVDLQQAPNGNLVYVDLRSGVVQEIRYAPGHRVPEARAIATPRSGRVPLTVRFTVRRRAATRTPLGCYWDFDDGVTASGCAVRHTFRVPGRRAVLLRASDGFKTREARVAVSVNG
jgi:glucose/arabinose dehydrogenase